MAATGGGKARPPGAGPQILCLGLFRTGTSSLSAALTQLGFKTYHGLDFLDDKKHWKFLERAAEATWPAIAAPSAKPPPAPFTRADWDEFFGDFDAVLDMASLWSEQLIAA